MGMIELLKVLKVEKEVDIDLKFTIEVHMTNGRVFSLKTDPETSEEKVDYWVNGITNWKNHFSSTSEAQQIINVNDKRSTLNLERSSRRDVNKYNSYSRATGREDIKRLALSVRESGNETINSARTSKFEKGKRISRVMSSMDFKKGASIRLATRSHYEEQLFFFSH